MISTMGRRPVMAAPSPAPTMAASLIGVSRHAILAEELHQVAADPPDPTERAHVLADEDDVWVACHFFTHGFVDCLTVGDCSHEMFLMSRDA